MENLEKVEGKYYTQNVDELPIEERAFFTQGKVANVNDFRFATEEEISAWREYERKYLEEMNLMNMEEN